MGESDKLMGLKFCEAGDVTSCFHIWCHALPKGSRELIWKLEFVALTLVIWNRNRIIFHQKVFDEERCFA